MASHGELVQDHRRDFIEGVLIPERVACDEEPRGERGPAGRLVEHPQRRSDVPQSLWLNVQGVNARSDHCDPEDGDGRDVLVQKKCRADRYERQANAARYWIDGR